MVERKWKQVILGGFIEIAEFRVFKVLGKSPNDLNYVGHSNQRMQPRNRHFVFPGRRGSTALFFHAFYNLMDAPE
jgi:hypothetical protein